MSARPASGRVRPRIKTLQPHHVTDKQARTVGRWPAGRRTFRRPLWRGGDPAGARRPAGGSATVVRSRAGTISSARGQEGNIADRFCRRRRYTSRDHRKAAARRRGPAGRQAVGAWKPVDQRGFSLENSSRTEPRNFTFGRSRLGVRSALSRAHSRKRGDCVAWPLLPCLRLPIPPRPCCIGQA